MRKNNNLNAKTDFYRESLSRSVRVSHEEGCSTWVTIYVSMTCSTPSPGQHDSFDATLPRRPQKNIKTEKEKLNVENGFSMKSNYKIF